MVMITVMMTNIIMNVDFSLLVVDFRPSYDLCNSTCLFGWFESVGHQMLMTLPPAHHQMMTLRLLACCGDGVCFLVPMNLHIRA